MPKGSEYLPEGIDSKEPELKSADECRKIGRSPASVDLPGIKVDKKKEE